MMRYTSIYFKRSRFNLYNAQHCNISSNFLCGQFYAGSETIIIQDCFAIFRCTIHAGSKAIIFCHYLMWPFYAGSTTIIITATLQIMPVQRPYIYLWELMIIDTHIPISPFYYTLVITWKKTYQSLTQKVPL